MITQTYTISTIKQSTPPIVKMSQYDHGSRTITFSVVDGSGQAVVLTGKTVRVEGTRLDGHAFAEDCTVSGSTASFTDTSDMTNAPGAHPAELVIESDGDRLGTMNFVISVETAAMDENADITEEDVSLFEQLLGSIEDATGAVEAEKTAALSAIDDDKDAALLAIAQGLASGSPLVVDAVADMTDQTAVYLYSGSESGYTAGNFYFWNGSAWVSGGTYGNPTVDAAFSDSSVNPVQNKVVSAAVSELKSDINKIEPFFEIDKTALHLGYINAYGTEASSTDIYCCDYVFIKGIKKIVMYTSLRYSKAAFYDDNKTLISPIISDQYSGYPGIYELTPPDNAAYFRTSCSNASYSQGAHDKFYALFVSSVNDVWKAIDVLNNKSVDPLNGFSDYVTQDNTTFIRKDLNSNLISNNDIIEGSWIDTTYGTFATNQYTSQYSRTDYIEVEAGASYTHLIDDGAYSYSVFDKDKQPISGYWGRFTVSNEYITIPPDGKYLGFCWYGKIGQTDYAMMIKGNDRVQNYEPPYDKLLNDPYATKKYVDSLFPETAEMPTLELPEYYECVVGDKFQMFWKGVVNAVEYENYYPEVVCDVGSSYTRYFEFMPTLADIGTHTMTVKLYDNGQNLLDEKTCDIIVKAKATSPASEKVLLYITDSLGNSGYVPDEFNRRLVGTGGSPAGDALSNITFIGTNESVSRGIKYVGNGGWGWAQYNTSMISNNYMWVSVSSHDKTSADQHSIYSDGTSTWKIETIETTRIKIIRTSGSSALPASGTLTWVSGGENHSNIVYTSSEQAAGNPLWDSTAGKISFSNFVSEQGESTLDYVYVLLGWNSTTVSESSLKSSVRTFLNNCLTDYPNCKIVILGIEIPARDGLARNYGQNAGILSSYRRSMNHVFNLNKWYAEIAEETAYIGKVSFVNIAGQFDTEYNMPSSTRAVNTRNATTEPYQINGVHPAESGYYQIADACYRDFVHKLQE